jgi:diadenosine tetraphosphate (Ap4A) HIT family hydrolase
MSNCVICDEAEGRRSVNFIERYPEVASRTVWSDGTVFSMPCIGQLSTDHFLVMPVEHRSTWRECGDEIRRLDEAIGQTSALLGISAPELLVFEHGAREPRDGGCGIYHAHLHVVPLNARVDPEWILGSTESKIATGLRSALEAMTTNGSYALCGHWGAEFRWTALTSPLPSQYLRRRVAQALGQKNWDWRAAGREPSLLSGLTTARTMTSAAL